MKHFVNKHKHHFGLWFLSAIVFVSSIFWLNKINRQENSLINVPEEKMGIGAKVESAVSSIAPVQSVKKGQLPATVLSKPPLAQDGSTVAITTASASSVASSSAKVKPEVETIIVTLKIAAAGETRELAVAAPIKSTVYDALTLLNQEKKLAVEFKTFAGMGAMVQAIDGVANDTRANKFWIYYINGKAAQVGVSYYIIKSNDLIEWKYEASQF